MQAYSAFNAVPFNQWSQIVATWTGSPNGSSMAIYLNGTPITRNSQDCSGTMSDDSSYPLTLGGTLYHRNPFAGTLDDLRVYNRVLSSSEVSALYKGAPKGSWLLDEGSGTTTADSSGNGNTGTFTESPLPTWATGVTDDGLAFSGSGGFVSIPASASLNNLQSQGNGGMTVMAWVYPTSSTPNTQIFLDKGVWTFGFFGSGAVILSHVCSTGLVQAYTAFNAIPFNQWSQIVATWTGSPSGSSMAIYLNGTPITRNSQDCSGTMSDDSSYPLTLGGTLYHRNPFAGTLDDIRVYNRVLSASEVNALYNAK